MAREPKVSWFVAESTEHPYGESGEKTFTDGHEAWSFAGKLRERPDVVHVQWEDRREDRALTMPEGELLTFGWVRDEATGTWREQYREQVGVDYLVG